jgi:hypothetical protein
MHPARKCRSRITEEHRVEKKRRTPASKAWAQPSWCATVCGSDELGYHVDGVRLTYKWGPSVWGTRPSGRLFEYTEQTHDSTGCFGPLPEAGSVRVRLGVRQERKKGLGVVALQAIPKGEIVYYLAGAVSWEWAIECCRIYLYVRCAVDVMICTSRSPPFSASADSCPFLHQLIHAQLICSSGLKIQTSTPFTFYQRACYIS